MSTFPNPIQEKKNQFFGSTPVLLESEKRELIVDVLTEERPDFSFEITEHPVEEGLAVNDSRIKLPTTLTLECIFLDMDLSIVGVGRNAMYGGFNTEEWKDKRDRLFLMAEEDYVIKVVTPFRTYESMVIENIAPNVTPQTASGLFATVTLREVVRVESAVGEDTKDIPKRLKSKEKETDTKKKKKPPKEGGNNKGNKTTEPMSNSAIQNAQGLLPG